MSNAPPPPPAPGPPPPAPGPPPSNDFPTAGTSTNTKAGSRWKAWHLIAVGLVALLIGIGIGGVGGDDPDDSSAADTSNLEEEIERLQGELADRDAALEAAIDEAEAELEGESPESEPEEESPEQDEEDEPDPGSEDLAIGETATVGDYEVTVTDFTADDTEAVLAANQFNEEPENGTYGTVTFDATYIGDGDGMPGFDLSVALVIDGVQHGDSDCRAVVESDAMNAPTLENGGTASGLVFCFDHPGLNDGARMFFEETISFDDARAYWSVS